MFQLGLPYRFCMTGVLYYALVSMWGGLAQGHGKDLLYAEFVTLFVTVLVDIILKRQCGKRDSVILVLTGMLVALLRNNGIYAVLPTIAVLIFYLKSIDRRRMCVVVGVTVMIYYSITRILYPGIGIVDGSIREALSMPFIQTARYVERYGDEVTDYEREVIGAVLDFDALKDYNPKQVDSVKNTYKDDDAKLPGYFKVWLQMFQKHPGSYISVFFNMGGGFMAPVYQNFPVRTSHEGEEYIVGLGGDHVFGDKFINIFLQIEYISTEVPVIKYCCMAGTYTWIVLICILLLIRRKLYGGIILFVPQLMNVLVCIASPTWHLRYAIPVAAVAPLMIVWTCYLVSAGD